MKTKPIPEMTGPETERFLAKLEILTDEDCWNWQATRITDGYGHFGLRGQLYLAHRITYQMEFGTIPDGALVLHHCDNPSCCNPYHLFLGDLSANSKDMYQKGRWALKSSRRGVLNPAARLGPHEVRQIRKLRSEGMKLEDVAAMFGISFGYVGIIAKRKKWAWLPDEPEEAI